MATLCSDTMKDVDGKIEARAKLAQELSGTEFGTVAVISQETAKNDPETVRRRKEEMDTVIVEPIQSPMENP